MTAAISASWALPRRPDHRATNCVQLNDRRFLEGAAHEDEWMPDDGPVMPSEISERGAHQCPEGNCGGNTRPAAGGERTLMGPAAHCPCGPQKRLTPTPSKS